MTRLYVSGPIKGVDNPELLFDIACKHLNRAGYQTVNPFDCGMIHMENCDCATADRKYRCNLRADIKAMMDCDGVAVLPNWENSKGVILELDIASKLSIPNFFITWWLDNAKTPSS